MESFRSFESNVYFFSTGRTSGCTAEACSRTTFIINEEGIIEQIFAGKQMKTKVHAEQKLGA